VRRVERLYRVALRQPTSFIVAPQSPQPAFSQGNIESTYLSVSVRLSTRICSITFAPERTALVRFCCNRDPMVCSPVARGSTLIERQPAHDRWCPFAVWRSLHDGFPPRGHRLCSAEDGTFRKGFKNTVACEDPRATLLIRCVVAATGPNYLAFAKAVPI
jgi:hypothetical protein